MRMRNSKRQWIGSTDNIARNFSLDTESEVDEKDLRICIQEQISGTVSNSPRL